MPYIEQKDRQPFIPPLNLLSDVVAARGFSLGELTYVLSMIAKLYLLKHGKSFVTICMIMGAFLCAALEFYRRVAVPYEDKKINLNGDCY